MRSTDLISKCGPRSLITLKWDCWVWKRSGYFTGNHYTWTKLLTIKSQNYPLSVIVTILPTPSAPTLISQCHSHLDLPWHLMGGRSVCVCDTQGLRRDSFNPVLLLHALLLFPPSRDSMRQKRLSVSENNPQTASWTGAKTNRNDFESCWWGSRQY